MDPAVCKMTLLRLTFPFMQVSFFGALTTSSKTKEDVYCVYLCSIGLCVIVVL